MRHISYDKLNKIGGYSNLFMLAIKRFRNDLLRPIRLYIVYALKILATLGVWTLLISAALWIVSAVGWYLITRFWLSTLLVPDSVLSTAITAIIAVIWAFLIYILALLWTKYNYRRYFVQNQRKYIPLKFTVPSIAWRKKEIDNSISELSGNVLSQAFAEAAANDTTIIYEPFIHKIIMPADFTDRKGTIILRSGETVTPEMIERVYKNGNYIKLVSTLSGRFEEDK